MTWLLFLLGSLRKALGALLGLIRSYPLQCALIVAVCASLWLWRGKQHALDQRDTARTELAQRIEAEKQATAAQIAENARIQQAYQDKADDAQRDHAESTVRDRGATARFVDAHRLRPGACPSGPSDTAPASGSAGVPAPAPAEALVAVTERDVTICGDLYTYSRSAYEWAQSLGTTDSPAH